MIDILVVLGLISMIGGLVFLYIAKKRIDRNEPPFGWKRKQFLAEQNQANSVPGDSTSTSNLSSEQKKKKPVDNGEETIRDLLELKDIEYGVIHRTKNEYCMVLNSDFVNFDLLKPSEQLAILQGYQQLYSVINFPIQVLSQAVRQDFRKDRARFEENLRKSNEHTARYNMDVMEFIQSRTMDDFRITLRIYYIVKYIYEPSKMAKLSKEQKEKAIRENLFQRAEIVRRALRRAKVDAEILDSLHALEVLKRSMNRDRTVFHPIEEVAEREKMAMYVTMDPTTIPGFEELVNDVEEAMEIVREEETEESTYATAR
ncbi:MAG: hypothetical protein ABS939_00090 [Psychrobacillus sp.]